MVGCGHDGRPKVRIPFPESDLKDGYPAPLGFVDPDEGPEPEKLPQNGRRGTAQTEGGRKQTGHGEDWVRPKLPCPGHSASKKLPRWREPRWTGWTGPMSENAPVDRFPPERYAHRHQTTPFPPGLSARHWHPAFASLSGSHDSRILPRCSGPPKRFVAVCATLGFHTPYLFPRETGAGYALTPYLEPLKALRDDFSVISGLSHTEQNGANGHTSELTWLTSAKHRVWRVSKTPFPSTDCRKDRQ